jgi:hypothetical protein
VPGAGFVGFAEGARGCSYVHRNISIELSCQLSTQLESPIFVQEKIIVSLRTVRARIVAFLKAPLATSRREGLESFCCQAAVQRLDAEARRVSGPRSPVCCFQGQAAFRPWHPDSAGMANDASFQPREVSISGLALLSRRPLE